MQNFSLQGIGQFLPTVTQEQFVRYVSGLADHIRRELPNLRRDRIAPDALPHAAQAAAYLKIYDAALTALEQSIRSQEAKARQWGSFTFAESYRLAVGRIIAQREPIRVHYRRIRDAYARDSRRSKGYAEDRIRVLADQTLSGVLGAPMSVQTTASFIASRHWPESKPIIQALLSMFPSAVQKIRAVGESTRRRAAQDITQQFPAAFMPPSLPHPEPVPPSPPPLPARMRPPQLRREPAPPPRHAGFPGGRLPTRAEGRRRHVVIRSAEIERGAGPRETFRTHYRNIRLPAANWQLLRKGPSPFLVGQWREMLPTMMPYYSQDQLRAVMEYYENLANSLPSGTAQDRVRLVQREIERMIRQRSRSPIRVVGTPPTRQDILEYGRRQVVRAGGNPAQYHRWTREEWGTPDWGPKSMILPILSAVY